MISGAMGETKIGNAQVSGAEYITSTDPSCLLHIDGMLRRKNSSVRTIYLGSILAQTAIGNPSEEKFRAIATGDAR